MNVVISKPSTVAVEGFILYINVMLNGQIYYHRKFDKPCQKAQFNLPDVGIFEINIGGKMIKADILPLIFSKKSINLPPVQKDTKKTLGRYTVKKIRGFVGSPAMISTAEKKIFLNEAFYELPIYAQKFIMFHELGHRYYYSEFACDLYATKQMLKKGYNESSCVNSLSGVLRRTPFNISRVQNVLGDLKS